MLVLSRQAGEVIRIGDDIVVTVLWADRGKVSLGIDAPKSVLILRGELADRTPPRDPPEEPRP